MPRQLIATSWKKLQARGASNANRQGAIFEYLVAPGGPFYLQAALAFVPNAIDDVVLYTAPNAPITLRIKSSL